MFDIQLDFHTMEDKIPPFNTDLLLIMKDNHHWIVSKYINDKEYGDLFIDHEGYFNSKSVEYWALLSDKSITTGT